MNKDNLKQWFVFTKRDRNAVIVLLSVISLVILLPYLLPAKKLEIHIDKDLQAELEEYRAAHPQTNNQTFYSAATDTVINDTVKKELFVFDPNSLNENEFARLGLPQKTIHTLINYRNKGGYFKRPEDIRKIYGLSKADADRLIPYIRIVSTGKKDETSPVKKDNNTNAAIHSYKKININTASAEDWKAFPGIGDVLANRIVKFRTSIGGFKSLEQVAKTYGLSDSVFQQIKPYLFLKDSTRINN